MLFIRAALIAAITVFAFQSVDPPSKIGSALYLGEEPGIEEYKRGMAG